MFGYIRPLVDEMKVRENEMFRAVYCGLCHAMGRHTGCSSRMFLSYDFVFLSLIRAALEGVWFQPQKKRCIVHPTAARPMAEDNPALSYAARAAAWLTWEKVRDDLSDERGVRRLAAHCITPVAAGMRRRADEPQPIAQRIASLLDELHVLEKENCDSIDRTAECFGTLLGEVFACDLAGVEKKIAGEVGRSVGRYIYVIDAVDDVPKDAAEPGKYNPILARYGSDILENREYTDRSGRVKQIPRLRREIAEPLATAVLCDLHRLSSALELIDFSGCQREAEGILKNIVYLGMPAEMMRVFSLSQAQYGKDSASAD